jgi:hypothetical protein
MLLLPLLLFVVTQSALYQMLHHVHAVRNYVHAAPDCIAMPLKTCAATFRCVHTWRGSIPTQKYANVAPKHVAAPDHIVLRLKIRAIICHCVHTRTGSYPIPGLVNAVARFLVNRTNCFVWHQLILVPVNRSLVRRPMACFLIYIRVDVVMLNVRKIQGCIVYSTPLEHAVKLQRFQNAAAVKKIPMIAFVATEFAKRVIMVTVTKVEVSVVLQKLKSVLMLWV